MEEWSASQPGLSKLGKEPPGPMERSFAQPVSRGFTNYGIPIYIYIYIYIPYTFVDL
jgi:hypothetical protein